MLFAVCSSNSQVTNVRVRTFVATFTVSKILFSPGIFDSFSPLTSLDLSGLNSPSYGSSSSLSSSSPFSIRVSEIPYESSPSSFDSSDLSKGRGLKGDQSSVYSTTPTVKISPSGVTETSSLIHLLIDLTREYPNFSHR
ncbi:hypothetical protein L1887_01948 [Cichorium endivia]|nr:hypothetical protein L1887_01948 [Cichorium endivia]